MKLYQLTLIITFFMYQNLFALEIGDKAPDFKTQGIQNEGREVSLADFKGKIVVLEWLNHGCPFSQKHYETNNMQTLQKKFTQKGVVWLSVISSAEGKQGYVTLKEALKDKEEKKSLASNILLDPEGIVGKLYGAKTTPHMFIVSKDGKLVYQGAIDDQPDLERDNMKSAKNYITQALDEVLTNKVVSVSSTKAYGCSVKYKN